MTDNGRPAMNLNRKIIISPQAMARTVGDEVVILDLDKGAYFGLNAVGARAWQLWAAQKTIAETVELIALEFEAPAETVTTDLLELVQDLKTANLVELSD
jgi:hypothetical protein